MVTVKWSPPPLNTAEGRDLFMLTLEDDSEEAPWMVMGDLQFWSASSFAYTLQDYAHAEGLGWYVASMLPITYLWPGSPHKRVLAPDAFVAFVPDHPRASFDVPAEGVFPPFVLEVVSPSSVERDEADKLRAYDFLKAREYALFTPRLGATSSLVGYRRDDAGAFVPWLPDAQGRLWSDVLGLYLIIRGTFLQAQTPDGRILLTPPQVAEARRRAEQLLKASEAANRRTAQMLEASEAARQRAEEEIEALRRELARLRGDAEEG